MSDPEGFLSRWSRLKQETGEPAADADRLDKAPIEGESKGEESARPSNAQPPETVDLGKLPPIESIAAGSDIRAFLAPGVPAELTHAALRRAWLVDPAIRDFVGLAEYAWDFNAPEGMSGFGPLLPTDDLKRLLAQALGDREPLSPQKSPVETPAGHQDPMQSEEKGRPSEAEPESINPVQVATTTSVIAQSHKKVIGKYSDDNAAVQETADLDDNTILPARHRHGGALPD